MKRRNFLETLAKATASVAVPAIAKNWVESCAPSKPKILIYGFNAFEDEVNVSQEVVEGLKQEDFPNVTIVTNIFGTDFGTLNEELGAAIELHQPDVIIGLGEMNEKGAKCPDIYLERKAHNRGEALGATAKLDTTELRQPFYKQELKVRESLDAGGGACNRSYFQSLKHFEDKGEPANAFFLHLKDSLWRKNPNVDALELEYGLNAFESPNKEDMKAYAALTQSYTAAITEVIQKIDKVIELPPQQQR